MSNLINVTKIVKWTEEEEQVLKNYLQENKNAHEIAFLMGRGLQSVRKKMGRMFRTPSRNKFFLIKDEEVSLKERVSYLEQHIEFILKHLKDQKNANNK
jgi:hypothetical protein